ncbi:MAG: glycosyltransferase [Candidatus Daviesbacteria bacterium]|nr:glycosyltransferase [Candidatus Daviesbacteria bacterium]
MDLTVSVIIPTFNEERFLPKLLASLKRQSSAPKEIIIADAYSVDNTRSIAKSFNCKVVDGGLPAKARNYGAKHAKGTLLLFLDSDVVLPPHFLEKTIKEISAHRLDIASCFITPKSDLKIDKFLHHFANHYLNLTQKFYPHIPGFCIFVKKDVHQMINGFDESLILAEDHDYVARAKKIGRFSYLKSYKIPVSVRRLSRDGRLKVALKYIAVELHLLFIGKIRKDIFKYKFGY